MLRIAGFFVLAFVLLKILQHVPIIGGFFHNIFAFWLVWIALSAALSRLSTWAIHRRRLEGMRRSLEAVDSPHNLGKLGALLLAQNRCAAAVPYLQRAAAAEPEVLEWSYRLGCALLGSARAEEAIELLTQVAERDEEYGYGAVQLRLAEAWTRTGEPGRALEAIERFERNHGENPESAYRRGSAERAAGRPEAARASFARVAELCRKGPRFQSAQNRKWFLRSQLRRWV
jgi:tetratricopeptide (TPR) repeat protein